MHIVIENLEEELSRWLYYEYENASNITGRNVVFTNVPPSWTKTLSKLGRVYQAHVWEVFKAEDLIILDPQAESKICPEDLVGKSAIVVGGILGDNPPQGRTRKMLSSHAHGAILRNIGKWQFSIDGAVYVAQMILDGRRLEDVEVKRGLKIKIRLNEQFYQHHIILPYAYPLRNGRPVINPKLVKYLIRKSLE